MVLITNTDFVSLCRNKNSIIIRYVYLTQAWERGREEGEVVKGRDDITWLWAQLPESSPPFPVAMVTCSKLPSEDGSVISNESEKLNSGRGLTVLKVTAQQKLTKEETRKRDGESHTLMQMQIIYSTAPLQARSGVSQMPQNLFFSFSPSWNTFPASHAHRYPKRNALPLHLFFFLFFFFTARKVATQQ